MSCCVLQGLAVLGHALAGLQLLPPEPWRLQYLAAARASSLASTPAGCSYLVHTLAAWQAQDSKHSSSNSSSIGSKTEQAAAEEFSNSTGGGNRAKASMQQLLQVLVQQCVQCFLRRGSAFTAEQLGMLCRGLAGLQLQGSTELAEQLEQVSGCGIIWLRNCRCADVGGWMCIYCCVSVLCMLRWHAVKTAFPQLGTCPGNCSKRDMQVTAQKSCSLICFCPVALSLPITAGGTWRAAWQALTAHHSSHVMQLAAGASSLMPRSSDTAAPKPHMGFPVSAVAHCAACACSSYRLGC
jgi:hypothetical protein